MCVYVRTYTTYMCTCLYICPGPLLTAIAPRLRHSPPSQDIFRWVVTVIGAL